MGFGPNGVNGGIPLVDVEISNPGILSRSGTMSDGQFDWGGRLQKSNGGVQRSSQDGRKSSKERKGRRWLDCEVDKPSRYESRT